MFGFFSAWKYWITIAILVLVIVWLLRNMEWKKKPKRRRRSPRDQIVSYEELSVLSEWSQDESSIESVSFAKPLPKEFVESIVPEKIQNPVVPNSVRPHSVRKETKTYSKGERLCKEAAERIYGVTFHHSIWPDWLRNPETGKAMELDLYNEELGIAIEYHGEQHYKYVRRFHNSPSDYESQVRRDNYKLDICEENGVYVITVPYYLPDKKIEAWIRFNDPTATAAREARKAQLNN